MQKKDFLWLFALPVYMLIGTIRHEAAHALAIWLYGAEILEFVVLPGFLDGHFYFGYVSWTGDQVSWAATAAPYFLDLLTFGVFFAICTFLRFKRRWLWLNLVIIGMISPLLNSGYQYLKLVLGMAGDIPNLLEELPQGIVHIYMTATLLAYFSGLWYVFSRTRRNQNAVDDDERRANFA